MLGFYPTWMESKMSDLLHFNWFVMFILMSLLLKGTKIWWVWCWIFTMICLEQWFLTIEKKVFNIFDRWVAYETIPLQFLAALVAVRSIDYDFSSLLSKPTIF